MISVIIPVFNAERFLGESIQSIRDQSYTDLEILICDDASTDSSLEIAKKHESEDSRIRVLQNERNIGYLRTTNKLAEMAKGEFLAFQDADDISYERRIELQYGFLLENQEYDLLGTNYSRIDEMGRLLEAKKSLHETHEQLSIQMKERNPFMKPSILFSRKLYEQIGLYREEFLTLGNISEDFDWLLRVIEKHKVANINHDVALYNYRSVSTAMTKVVEDIDRFFGTDICLKLAEERRETGTDSIEKKDFVKIQKWKEEWRKPFDMDSCLKSKKMYEVYMYSGLYKSAFKEISECIARKPFQLKYWKLALIALKKTI